VAYFYDQDIGNYQYVAQNQHPLKPHRTRMTDVLIRAYGMDKQLIHMDLDDDYYESVDLTKFHSDDYIDFLSKVTPDNKEIFSDHISRFNFGEDCPVFLGLYDYCKTYAAGSVLGADYVLNGEAEIAINWSGGLHHAKKQEASGFCYINDCVLAILELLKRYERVLYIDIDCHHGDGVEEAFYTTDRVMTLSLHKFGDYFPGTGDIGDIGEEAGKNYSINFPLQEGVDDFTYEQVYRPLIKAVMDHFKPEAVLLQMGTDSLSGDRLGMFNLSIKGHGDCLTYLKTFHVPILLQGGGGYTMRNVSRCWAYETSLALGVEIPNEIPDNEFSTYFHPDRKLHIATSNMENNNKREDIEKHLKYLLNVISKTQATNVDHSNYRNGGDFAEPTFKVDEKEKKERAEDKNPDAR